VFSGRLQEQYTDSSQQSETAQLGMWVFIATEVMFFGALIFSYMIYRVAYPEQFRLAGHDSFILLGSINQALLITSSLSMVLAVRAAKADQQRALVLLLAVTAALGLAFLGVKGYEYAQDVATHSVPVVDYIFKPGEHRPTESFWSFSSTGTGRHPTHRPAGIALGLTSWCGRRRARSLPTMTRRSR